MNPRSRCAFKPQSRALLRLGKSIFLAAAASLLLCCLAKSCWAQSYGALQPRQAGEAIETEPHAHAFTGRLVVLLDSESGSAAEVFARVIQLQKRGLVLDDRSAGMVTAAERFMHKTGQDEVLVYGSSVTEARIRMTDSQSLERNGVVPDQTILPTADDLAAGRDPALARAAEVLNVQLTAEQAAELFPFQWPEQ